MLTQFTGAYMRQPGGGGGGGGGGGVNGPNIHFQLCCCNIGFETHLYLKSREISFSHNILFCCPISLKFCKDRVKRIQNLLARIMCNNFNKRDGVSNHRRIHCLPNRLFRCISKKISKLHVTGFCEENSPVTGEFPSQRASNAENVSIWWRHHVFPQTLASLRELQTGTYICKSASASPNLSNLRLHRNGLSRQ